MNKTARYFLKEAIDHYNAGQYQDALTACDSAIQLDPLFARAYHGRGLALVKLRSYTEALENYQKARELVPKNPKLHADIGELLFLLEDYEKAGISFRRAIELDEQYKSVYRHKTQELLEKAFAFRRKHWDDQYIPTFEKSEGTFRQVLLFDPTNEKARDFLANPQPRSNSVAYSSSSFGGPSFSRAQREYEAMSNNQWTSIPSVHPANCRCHECWEP